MDEETFLSIIKAFGTKIYEMQLGTSAMFNLCVRSGVFTETAFHAEMKKLEENFPELRTFRDLLEKLDNPTEAESLAAFLKGYRGPVQ